MFKLLFLILGSYMRNVSNGMKFLILKIELIIYMIIYSYVTNREKHLRATKFAKIDTLQSNFII